MSSAKYRPILFGKINKGTEIYVILLIMQTFVQMWHHLYMNIDVPA